MTLILKYIYQTHKNFGSNVSAKSCSDQIFTHKVDFRTLDLLNKLFCAWFFRKVVMCSGCFATVKPNEQQNAKKTGLRKLLLYTQTRVYYRL